eukprot:CAMPEP_0113673332 /NCGR_PEP_ID=MMETSP0038_2-20120614/6797_1 /TAXON_ID=2898 /ORGANISM="Cryptomonas paramecium" /LENGTH=185 /DNA_ID=CAMNT_0000589775 /DNA_START=137 /DNA_END=694 /DNA_ORIENTATION=- /assembly_acc=CAM_ASM_000170
MENSDMNHSSSIKFQTRQQAVRKYAPREGGGGDELIDNSESFNEARVPKARAHSDPGLRSQKYQGSEAKSAQLGHGLNRSSLPSFTISASSAFETIQSGARRHISPENHSSGGAASNYFHELTCKRKSDAGGDTCSQSPKADKEAKRPRKEQARVLNEQVRSQIFADANCSFEGLSYFFRLPNIK